MSRARYFEVAVDTVGRPMAGVTVNVYNVGTTTPISATIYSAASGVATLANPLTTSAQGEIEFWLADPAEVDLKWSKAGSTAETHTVGVLAPLSIGTYVRVNEGPLSLLDSRIAADNTGVTSIHSAMLTAYALVPNGGTLYAPPGAYNMDVGELPPSGVTIDGSGPGNAVSPTVTTAGKAIQFRASTAIPVMFDMVNTAGVKLKNIGIDGRDSASTLVRISGYQNEVLGCDVRRGVDYGVLIRHLAVNNHENNVKDSLILMNKLGTCLRIGDSLAGFYANDNEISGNVLRGGLRIVHLYNCGANRILGNHLYAYPALAGTATESMLIEGSSGILVGGGNQFDLDAGGPAVRIVAIDASHWCYDIQVVNNFILGTTAIVDNTESPFFLDASAVNSRVDRIEIGHNSFSYDPVHRPKYFIGQTGANITNINFDGNTSTVEPGTARFQVDPDTAVGNGVGTASQTSVFRGRDVAVPIVVARRAGIGGGRLFEAQSEAGAALSGIDSRGAYRAPDGSAATAAISFQDETGMGLFRIAAGTLGFAAAAAEAARLTGSAFTLPSGAALHAAFRPTAALAETFSRYSKSESMGVLTSGTMYCVAVYLPAGLTITSLSFMSGSTAAVTPTNQWFALLASSLDVLRQTVDGTTAAWGTNTIKTLALTSTFTTTYAGLHYFGIMVAAATVPTILGMLAGASALLNLAPRIAGFSTTGLTVPAGLTSPATALSGSSFYLPWAYVS